MTVSYNLDVSRKSWFNAFKILCRWRGSIWRLVFKELVLWLIIYYIVMIVYRSEWILTPDEQRTFERLAHHIADRMDYIPLTFILAFFVTIVLGRWSRIIDNMGYVENAALTIAMTVRGKKEDDIIAKRAMVRYLCLCQVFVFRDISVRVRRRFPNLESIIQAGFLEEHERDMIEELEIDSNKYWLPINWAASLAYRLRESGNLVSETPLMNILAEFKNFRTSLSTLCNFDWVPVPVAYPQVVYFSVYIYFMLALISRQFIIGNDAANKDVLDLAFPFMTVLQFIFYVGWMKVAETLLNPMGEDDDHFECNSLIDNNIATALAIVDDTYDQVPTLKMDRFKTQIQEPMYAESAVRKFSHAPQFIGSAAHLVMASKDEQVNMIPVKNEAVIEEIVDPDEGGMSAIGRRIRRMSDTSAFTRTTRRASAAVIDSFPWKKHSTVSPGTDNRMNETELGNSHKLNSGAQSPATTHRAEHIMKAPALEEISEGAEEECPSTTPTPKASIVGTESVPSQDASPATEKKSANNGPNKSSDNDKPPKRIGIGLVWRLGEAVKRIHTVRESCVCFCVCSLATRVVSYALCWLSLCKGLANKRDESPIPSCSFSVADTRERRKHETESNFVHSERYGSIKAENHGIVTSKLFRQFATPSYKVTYFPGRGAAEVCRQMLHISGTPFEDERIPLEKWEEYKKTTPFGHLPLLTIDGKVLPQSMAMARYLARKLGFDGKTDFESAWVDAIGDQFKDYITEIRSFLMVAYGFGEGDKAKLQKEVGEPARDKFFGILEKILKDNGNSGHLVGDSLTWIDLFIADHVSIIVHHLPGFLDAYPNVLKLAKQTSEIPKVKEWLEKRPQTNC